MNEAGGDKQATGSGGGKPPMRDTIIEAAFDLFLKRGYEQTTINDIVERAGVGRRSFFRYFPSKEEVVFPEHERALADVTEFLGPGADEENAVQRVCDAARLVLRMYAENPTFSVQRYLLTRKVPGLRTYELSVVWRYERTLAAYLRRRFEGRPDGTVRADVIAAAVVAAHNNALRSWLRSGAKDDADAAVDKALALVQNAFDPQHDGEHDAGRHDRSEDDDVVVVISKRRTPMWRVVQQIESAVGRD